MHTKEEIKDLITDDYIRGLIEGEGCFGNMRNAKGDQIPAFVLKMHMRDKELIEAIRDYLGLPDRVYEYKYRGRHFALLQVRDIGSLKNVIIPLFRGKLLGHKGLQLKAWLDNYPYLKSLNIINKPKNHVS
ncbi:MAG: LAGLIDADG family homing endonuclease [Candidatus Sungbacteria bacterium]|uniref:LAGLIDADG family homing endonuclease n=1 Tax=Candidatus Sungiibacteriota bacterium TaxID=2750080 RepID=A0A931SBB9_9BACT|nr:LAGLIDADG family homing endonuclease [Candidatus Sungbacteria bacterium]